MSNGTSPQKDGKPPCKVVVIGAEGQSREKLQAFNDQFSGEISRFYSAARQNSDNSRGDVWHQHTQLPSGAGRLDYSSNQGVETMTIRLNPKFLEGSSEEKKPEPKREVWDWLVLEIEIPSMLTGAALPRMYQLSAAARFYEPPLKDIPDPDNPPTEDNPDPPPLWDSLERVALDQQGYNYHSQEPQDPSLAPDFVPGVGGEGSPKLMFAGAPRIEQIGDRIDNNEGVLRCSVLVDIRPAYFKDKIEIDLWAQIHVSTVKKEYAGAIVRSPNIIDGGVGAAHGRWFADQVLYYSTGLDWWEDQYPATLASIPDDAEHRVSTLTTDAKKYHMPYPYTHNTFTDSVASDISNFTMTGYAWLAPNRSSGWHMFGNEILVTWQNPSPPAPNPPPWSGGYWADSDWSDYAVMDGAFAGVTPATESFTGTIAGLGYKTISHNTGGFWVATGSVASAFGYGDPGTPPPDVGFHNPLGGSGPDDYQSFNFMGVDISYFWRPSFTAASGTFTVNGSIKGGAFKGMRVDPPQPPEGGGVSPPDVSRWVWSMQVPRAIQDVYDDMPGANTVDFGQIEINSKFPARPEMDPIDGGSSIPIDNLDDPAVPYDKFEQMKHIGRVVFDQTGGGRKFKFLLPGQIDPDKLPQYYTGP